MTKLWLFKPAANWECCGGGLVIIAEDFEEAQQLFEAYQLHEGTFSTLVEKLVYPNDSEAMQGIWRWELVESFELLNEASRVVMWDYNFA